MSWWKKTLKWVGVGLEVAGEVQGGTLGKVLDKSGEALAREMAKEDKDGTGGEVRDEDDKDGVRGTGVEKL